MEILEPYKQGTQDLKTPEKRKRRNVKRIMQPKKNTRGGEAKGRSAKEIKRDRVAFLEELKTALEKNEQAYNSKTRSDSNQSIEGASDLFTKLRLYVDEREKKLTACRGLDLTANVYQDQVLDLVFARASGGATDACFNIALEAYLSQGDRYDVCLGDLIPKDFLAQADHIAELRAYRNGTNNSAALDLYIYRRRLCDPQWRTDKAGLPTGISELDQAVNGLRGITLVSGPAGVGKTSLALYAAKNALMARPDTAVLAYSLEMPKPVILDRFVCMESGFPYDKLVSGDHSESERQKVLQAIEKLENGFLQRMKIYEPSVQSGSQLLSADQIFVDAEHLMNSTSTKSVFVVIDSFQKIRVPSEITNPLDADQYRLEMLEAVGAYGHPSLVISQLKKTEDSKQQFNMNDLRGSAQLAFEANNVLLMWPDAAGSENHIAPTTIRIAKCRDGGERKDIKVWFDYQHYQFLSSKPKPGAKGSAATNAGKQTQGIDPMASGGKRRKPK